MPLVKDALLARINNRDLAARLVPPPQFRRRYVARRSHHRTLHTGPPSAHTGKGRCPWLKWVPAFAGKTRGEGFLQKRIPFAGILGTRQSRCSRLHEGAEMSEGRRARPQPTPETQHFWDGTREGELRLQRCNACGKVYFPPRPCCSACA